MSDGTKIGLVAFFDILGYQNLLKRNEPEKIAEEVLPILLGIKEKVKKIFLKNFEEERARPGIELVMENMKWLSFSDTILLTLPIDESKSAENSTDQIFNWMVFVVATDIVQRELFMAGLPARGAIDYGKFYVQDTCFAGHTIVNAYQLSEQIEISACVLTNEAAKKLHSLEKVNSEKYHEAFLLEYLVPMKGDREQHMLVVKSISPTINNGNVHESVMQAFWGHGKDIPQVVRPKIIGTEQWMEFQLKEGKKLNNE